MATVVDALVVTLGLDAKGFKKGTEETEKSLKATASASVRFAKEMEASGKQAAQVFSAIKMEALGLIGVLSGTAGLGAVAFNASKAMADLGRQAAAMNMPVDQLDAFGKAVASAGGDSAIARGQLQSLADTMAMATMYGGDPKLMGQFAAIGADPRHMTAIQVMEKAADYAKTHDLLMAKTQLSPLGLGDDATLNFLRRGSAGVRAAMNESQRIGVISPEMAQNAIKLQEAFEGLGQALGISKDRWINSWSPFATDMLNWSKEMVIQNPELVKGILNLGTALALLGSVGAATGLARLFGLFSLARGGAAIAGGAASAAGAGASSGWLAGIAAMLGLGAYNGANDLMYVDEFGHSSGTWGGNPNPTIEEPKPSPTPERIQGPGQQGTRKETIEYFMARGWAPHQAAAIADVFREESGYKQNSYNPKGGGNGARGALQLRGSRLVDYIKMFGHDPTEGTYAESLQFAQWELTTRGKEKKVGDWLKNATSEEKGLQLLNQKWMRPNQEYRNMKPEGIGDAKVSINTINVQTAATDATGIAASIKGAIANSFIAQANPGYA
jgi:hypothetical protein